MSVPKEIQEKYILTLRKKRATYEKEFFELSRKERSGAESFFMRIITIVIVARRAIPFFFLLPMLLAHVLYQSFKLSHFLKIAQPITFYTFESLALLLVAAVFYAFLIESIYTKFDTYVAPSLSFANLDMRKERIAREYRFVISELERYNALKHPPNDRLMKYELK